MSAHPRLSVVESHQLGSAEADRLWNWVLARQGLAPHTRLASVEAITEATLGLHAARLPSPFATAAARGTTSKTPLELFTPNARERLVTVRCMRKTLHTLPLDLAAAAHGATRHFRERDALRAVTNAGHTETTIAPVTTAITEILAEHGPLEHRALEGRLAAAGLPVRTTRVALKLAWERGHLTCTNHSDTWNRQHRVFSLTRRTHPDLDIDLDRETATERLLNTYIEIYGPASLRDATWWSGLSQAEVVTAMERAGAKLVELATPWTSAPLYMSAEGFAAFTTDVEEPITGINLLAHEDVALKAYFQTRARYLHTLPARRAFNQIGEVLPTILINGRITGTWFWDHQARRVRTRTVPGLLDRTTHHHIRTAANRLTTTLRAGYTAV